MTTALDAIAWSLARGTGLVALVMLTISLAVGIAVRNRVTVPGQPRFVLTHVHRNASLIGVALVAVHLVTLMANSYAGVSLVDTVIPFAMAENTFANGLGTLAVDILLLVSVTGLLRSRMNQRTWKAVHATSYLLWPIALLHGIGAGTDAQEGWYVAVTAACAAVVCGAAMWRLLTPARTARSATARLRAG